MTRAERRRRMYRVRRRRVDRIRTIGGDYWFGGGSDSVLQTPGRAAKHRHRPVFRSDPDIGVVKPAILRAMYASGEP